MISTGANGENRVEAKATPPFSPLPPVQPSRLKAGLHTITAADLARLFGLTMVKAHRLMRTKDFPHLKIGRDRVTTEPWLASWMAANVKNPPRAKSYDPLDAAVVERAAWAVGKLVEEGRLQVVGGGLSVAGGEDQPANNQPPTTHKAA